MAGGPTRQDTYRITVSVAGINTGIWDKMTGGDVDSEENKYAPGGMAPHVSLGGRRTVENITVSRLYRLERDHVDLMQRMIDWVGRAQVVAKQPLDIEGNGYGSPLVYQGTLKRVSPPEVDSEASDAGLWEIEVTTDGFPSV